MSDGAFPRVLLATGIEGHRGAHELLDGGRVDRVAFMDVDARVALASRPALKMPCGSASDAPLKKLSFTWSLNAAAATTLPLKAKTGVSHFHSSAISGAASRIRARQAGKQRTAPVCQSSDIAGDSLRRRHAVVRVCGVHTLSFRLAGVSLTLLGSCSARSLRHDASFAPTPHCRRGRVEERPDD